jgi:hypothetical protein
MSETHAEYKSRILGYLGGRDPMPLLASAPATLTRLLDGLPEGVLRARPIAPKWSIAEIVAHLADDELVATYRIRLILSAPGTEIQAFDQARWAEVARYADTDVDTTFELYRRLREENLRQMNSLGEEEWNRFGVHAERGRESIRDIAAYYAGHDLNHFQQIERILERAH